MDAEDPSLRERLIGLKLRRNELAKQAAELHRYIASGEPEITPEKIGRVAIRLRDSLHHGPPEVRQAYARLVMDEVRVSDEEIRIGGSKAALARYTACDETPVAPAVLSFVQEWLSEQEPNCPLKRPETRGFYYFSPSKTQPLTQPTL
jgi:hypothetical protein